MVAISFILVPHLAERPDPLAPPHPGCKYMYEVIRAIVLEDSLYLLHGLWAVADAVGPQENAISRWDD